MARPSCKKQILDAAEAIVLESGAAHLTLDAVAERCGISKGGLIYHFPTKETLLTGMIARLEEKIDLIRDAIRHKDGDQMNNELAVDIRMMRELSPEDYRLSAALLAVVALKPDLMDPFRAQHHKRFWDDLISSRSFTRSAILFFAAMGLHFHQLLNISIVSNEQRKEIYDELLRLAEVEKKDLSDLPEETSQP